MKHIGFISACCCILILIGVTWLRNDEQSQTAESVPVSWSTNPTPRQGKPSPIIQVKHSEAVAHKRDQVSEPASLVIPIERLPKDAIPDEIILRFYDAHDLAAAEALARQLGIPVLDRLAVGNSLRLSVSDPHLLTQLLKRGPTPLDQLPNYYVRHPENEDNAPLAPVSGYTAFGDKALAWLGVSDNSDWGTGVKVAVLDSGITDTAALRGVTITRMDLVQEPGHVGAHGTAVASLIAGRGAGVQGVAPGVELLSVKVLSDAGVGDTFTLAKGIIQAVDNGAELIVFSLASRGDSPVVADAIAYAAARKVPMVAAPGNDGLYGVSYPARYDSVIAPGAVDANGQHLFFSNRGTEVDLVAPGAGVAASLPGEGTVSFSGTSASVPFVAGAVATLLAESPGISPDEIRDLLARYSNDLGEPGPDSSYGFGALNMKRLTERNTVGIYDMAAMVPNVRYDAPKDILHIDVSAQNRGTETIASVEMAVVWNGHAETFTFPNVYVGDTVFQPFEFPRVAVPTGDLDFRFSVMPVGVADATPGNNALQSRIAMPTPE